jgi:primosomal replication protein N
VQHNQLLIDGVLSERQPLRHTPAGVPVSEARLQHTSEQEEAGLPRQVSADIGLIALGEQARWLDGAPLGKSVRISGFLSLRSRNSRSLVLHVQQIEFL